MMLSKQTFEKSKPVREYYGAKLYNKYEVTRLGVVGFSKEEELSSEKRKQEFEQVASVHGASWRDVAKQHHVVRGSPEKKKNEMIDNIQNENAARIVRWLVKLSPKEIDSLTTYFSVDAFINKLNARIQ
jgi:hypothetical protein